MIKVSHETPLCLLDDSRLFNDYDYCLPHLLDQEQGYQDSGVQSATNLRHWLWRGGPIQAAPESSELGFEHRAHIQLWRTEFILSHRTSLPSLASCW